MEEQNNNLRVKFACQSWFFLGVATDEFLETNEMCKDLGEADDFGIITKDGKFGGIVSRSEKAAYENADRLQEIMIGLMKNQSYRSGTWFWRVSANWQTVNGVKWKE